MDTKCCYLYRLTDEQIQIKEKSFDQINKNRSSLFYIGNKIKHKSLLFD